MRLTQFFDLLGTILIELITSQKFLGREIQRHGREVMERRRKGHKQKGNSSESNGGSKL